VGKKRKTKNLLSKKGNITFCAIPSFYRQKEKFCKPADRNFRFATVSKNIFL
jgi:hypothetical protein